MLSESLPSAISTLLKRLGYAGLLPFVGLAVLLWLVKPGLHSLVAMALTTYAALIASFLGGLHWGVAFVQGDKTPLFHAVWGVTPSLLAWIALLLPPAAGLLVLSALLVACYAVDHATWPKLGLRHWLSLRLHLTLVATLSCLAGAAAA